MIRRIIAWFRIPRGLYCYRGNKTCPYWGCYKNLPKQENGYCTYLGNADYECEYFSLLWDQCKECGIKH